MAATISSNLGDSDEVNRTNEAESELQITTNWLNAAIGNSFELPILHLHVRNRYNTESETSEFECTITNTSSPRETAPMNHVLGAIIRAPFFHPLRLVTSLVQLGHEPLPPSPRYSFIAGQYLYYYPGFTSYARHIVNERGWRALYRGIVPAIIEDIVYGAASDLVRPIVMSIVDKMPLSEVPNGDTPDTVANITTFRATLVRGVRGFFIISMSGCAVEFLARPFRVITLRTMAQHVGEETIYSGVIKAVKEVYGADGIRGFYAGLGPALIHHLVSALVYEGIVITIEELVKFIPGALIGGGLAILKGPFASYTTRAYTYPFILIGNLMAINGTALKAASLNPSFSSWKDCWSHLRSNRILFRGNTILFPRYAQSDPRNIL